MEREARNTYSRFAVATVTVNDFELENKKLMIEEVDGLQGVSLSLVELLQVLLFDWEKKMEELHEKRRFKYFEE